MQKQICNICDFNARDNYTFTRHLNTQKHSRLLKEKFGCPKCLKPFKNFRNLCTHLKKIHGDTHVNSHEERMYEYFRKLVNRSIIGYRDLEARVLLAHNSSPSPRV